VTDAREDVATLASWLCEQGADLPRAPSGGVVARVDARTVSQPGWRSERATLLVRYLNRRVVDRQLSIELTRLATEATHQRVAEMRRRIAAARVINPPRSPV